MTNISSNPSEVKIGWIGTGIMGAPMAMHLVDAGYDVSVYSRTKSKSEKLITRGCDWYDTPSAIAENCQVIFTIVGYPQDVEEVYFGRDGIIQTIQENAVAIDMTTTLPALAVKIHQAAREKGAWSIDAPVSGGEIGAINGALSVMIGGDEEVVNQVLPILEKFSKKMVYQGKAGSGQHTKMCNQITIAGTMIGVCECLIYSHKAGLDPETVLKSIGGGAAACWTLENLAPRIVHGDFEPGFMVEHFIKDLGIALEEAERMKLSLPGLALAKQLYLSLMATGMGTKGTQALYLALERMSGMD
jgi:3-hydroxyisobutyrate dehydrogenase